MITAAIVYIAGALAVTVMVNIPLNDALAGIDPHAGSAETLQQIRNQFAPSWNRWHLVRTVAALISTILLLLAAERKNNNESALR